MKEKEKFNELINSAKFRAKPFWAWNGDLKIEELFRQIDVMKEMGFGGFFMHSRSGLITEYLGDEWFDLINKCAEYAKQQGLEAWIYDEDRWPSGSAGGLATINEDNRMRFISLYNNDDYFSVPEVKKVLRKFAVKINKDNTLEDYYSVTCANDVVQGYVYNVFCLELMKTSATYNGYSYLDTMSKSATECFLQITHEKYKKMCGDKFGFAIKGVFTDEPYRGALFSGFSISNSNNQNMAPFTDELFDFYKNTYGESLEDVLPELFYKKLEWNKVPYQYINVCNELFLTNFFEPYHEWCKKNNLLLTGHILHEDSLSIQTVFLGSALSCYEYMDYPGVDVLTEGNSCYWIPKQCSSVARQLKKEMTLTELYGCTGWQVSFANYKKMTDWQILFGATLRCPHLSWYTMGGEAKRDYPASILHQSSWYKDYSMLENYFVRLTAYLSVGNDIIETLVIDPVESMWGYVHKDWLNIFTIKDDCVKSLEENYVKQFQSLVSEHIEFDYGNERIMQRYGSVFISNGIPVIKIGNVCYKEVLLQNCVSLRKSTQKLLDEFVKIGGRVCNKIQDLEPNFKISAPKELGITIRKTDSEVYIFLLNMDNANQIKNAQIKLPAIYDDWSVEKIDLFADKVVKTFQAQKIILDFEPSQECFLRVTKTNSESFCKEPNKIVSLPNKMNYELTEPNILALDSAIFYIDGAVQQNGELTDALKIDRLLREKYSLINRGGEMIQPWFDIKNNNDSSNTKLCDLDLKFVFNLQEEIKNLSLVVEKNEFEEIYINDTKLDTSVYEAWLDICFNKIPIPNKFLKHGENILIVKNSFTRKSNTEAIYILGDFAVELPNNIKKLPPNLMRGDITTQGLPFYSGSIKYHTGIKSGEIRVKLDNLLCSIAILHGGQQKEYIAFAPYESANITLVDELIIETRFTRRNTFGPLHLLPSFQASIDPSSFVTCGKNWSEKPIFIKQGL